MTQKFFRNYAVGSLAFVVACAVVPKPLPPEPTPPKSIAFDLVACKQAPVDNYCDGPANVRFKLHVKDQEPNAYLEVVSDANGYVYVPTFPDIPDSDITITAAEYEVYGPDHFRPADLLAANDAGRHNFFVLNERHVDASKFTLPELAAIRGAMWPRATSCQNPPILPYGNRPNQTDNIIATTYFDNYTAQQQEDIARCLKAAGWTHVVVGGLVDSWAYHGQYIGHDYTSPEAFDKFLDIHQWFYDHGLKPITFIHEDGASYEQTEQLVKRLIVGNARAQRLIRIVVMPGWEPTKYGWSSCTWAKYIRLARDALPHALNLLHTVSDVDAPVGSDALCNDDDPNWNPGGNGAGWKRVIDAGLHGWLIQNGPYSVGPSADPNRAREFAAQFKPAGDGATYHGAAWHFAGNAGWPTSSAWGPDTPICLYAAEHTAYEAYWYNRPSDGDRHAWGDIAVASSGSVACGYLDGGSVPVPVRR